jgi:hypothetical protein
MKCGTIGSPCYSEMLRAAARLKKQMLETDESLFISVSQVY